MPSTKVQEAVQDQWSANPFKSNDPRHEQFEMQQRTAQREAAVNRVGHTIAKDMRTHDFTKSGIAMGRSTTAEDFEAAKTRHEQHIGGQTNNTGDLNAFPSKLDPPRSYAEAPIKVAGHTCSTVLQGGSLVLLGTKEGFIIALNGFTNQELARVSVEEAIARSDNQLEAMARLECRDASRRPERKAKRGDSEKHHESLAATKVAEENNSSEKSPTVNKITGQRKQENDPTNKGAYPIAVASLGESSYVAFVLSNEKVRVYDAMSLVAVDEITFAAEDSSESANNCPITFAKILPIDCTSDPISFFVVCRDRIVSFLLSQPATLADRCSLAVSLMKTYEKLHLNFVSASTDVARTMVFVGDDSGDIWNVDVKDLLLVDSWTVVPPPPGPPNTRKEQRKGNRTPRLSSPRCQENEKREVATAIGAYQDYIYAGTSEGRVVVWQTQPYGEKPLPVLDEIGAHSTSIIGSSVDDRLRQVWFASSDGVVTSWSLDSKSIVYKTSVPVGSLVTDFALLPHATTNKIWTITISGINKVWITEDHQTHDGMGVAHTHMEAVLARQTLAIQQKEEEVAAAEGLLLSRMNQIVETLAEQNRQRILRAYYYSWLTARLKAITKRKREDAAEALNHGALHQVARCYYLRLVAHMTAQRARKQNEAMVLHLKTQREDELRGRYFNCLRRYVIERRAADHTYRLAEAVSKVNGATTLIPFYLDRWRRFVDERRKAAQHQRYLALMERTENKRTAHHAFIRWIHHIEKKRVLKAQRRSVDILGDAANLHSAKAFYNRWAALSTARKRLGQQERWVAFVDACYNQNLRRSVFTTFHRFRLLNLQLREEKAFSDAKEKRTALESQYAAVAPMVERREKLAALKEKLVAAKAQKDTLLKDEAAVSDHNAQLRGLLTGQSHPILKHVSDPRRASLLALMGRLRDICINCETDSSTITKGLNKAKVEGAVTAFSGYVADLKATILIQPPVVPTATPHAQTADEAGSSHVSDVQGAWPSGDAEVLRIVARVDAMQAPLLQTIKNMVVSFDSLANSEMANLKEGDELIANSGTLILLADTLQSTIAKKKSESASTPIKSRRL